MTSSENRGGAESFSATLGGSVQVICTCIFLCLFAVGATAAAATLPDPEALSGAVVEGLIDKGRYPQAEVAARELLLSAESMHGIDSAAAADARDLLVAALIANSRATEPVTRDLAERAVELRLRINDADSPATTNGLLNLGRVLKENKKLDEAEAVLLRALEIRERELGLDHLDIARVLNELGSVAYRGRNSDLAEALYGRALTMLEATVGGDHPECAVSLTGLFAVLVVQRQLMDAERHQMRSLEIRRSSLGPEHPLTAESMRVLSMLWRRMGKDEQSEALLRRAVDILDGCLGPEHPQTGVALNTLAIQVRNQGRYAEARNLFERALEAFDTSLDPHDPRIAGVLNNLAAVYRELGDFTEAEACLRRSLAIREQRYGADHPAVAQSLGNLALVLVEAECHGEAIPLLLRALGIKERAYGGSSVDYAVTLAGLGRAYRAGGDLQRAEDCLEEVVAVLETSLGAEHTTVADQLNNLAMVRHERGELDAAREGFLRAIEIRRAAEGKDHPRIGRFQHNIARVEADAGNLSAAMAAALSSEALGRAHLQLTATGLAEGEAVGFDQHTRNRLDLLLAFALRWPQHANEVWDALIRSRGLVLTEIVRRRRRVRAESPEIAERHDELAGAVENLTKLRLRGPGKAPLATHRDEIDGAMEEVERAERALGTASAEFRLDRRRSQIGFEKVKASLPRTAALVGITRRAVFSDPVGTASPNTFDYMAMVLAPGATTPKAVILGPAPEVDALVAQWRGWAAGAGEPRLAGPGVEEAYRRAAEELRRLIWDPVSALVGDAEMVFVVPDGELALVNFSTLPVGASSYLIESGPLIHMLDEERDLVALGGERPRESLALLALGDPDFDSKVERGARLTADESVEPMRGVPEACGSLENVVFQRLPATAVETEKIAALWRTCGEENPPNEPANCGRSVVRLTGTKATEAEFKRLAPGRTVLHLATHGFVLGDRCEVGSVVGRGIGGLAPSRPKESVEEEMPAGLLGISGLALAGANHRAQAGPDEEDGILTAMEISNLNLDGVEWAVLSACDSGVGESVSGEGVFGFRRAFRIAGARTVIMSLWPVEDAATQVWMASLYRARLKLGLSTAESVRYAGLELLGDRRSRGDSTHPFFWGAFIAAGEWR